MGRIFGYFRGCRAIVDCDWQLAIVLLAVRSLFKPYVGLLHDAQLYSLQVLNRAGNGFLDGDLFFAYGSQDTYSIFSIVLAPWARWLGVPITFTLAYLVCMYLLIWAEVRIVRHLMRGPIGTSLVATLVVMADLNYGLLMTFHVHEPFLTARLPAEALTLWALSNVLEARHKTGLLLALVATAFHPLMGIGGLSVVLGAILAIRWGLTTVFVAGALPVAAITLLHGAGGLDGLGIERIDGTWKEVAVTLSPVCYVSCWIPGDTWRFWLTLTLCASGYRWLSGGARRQAALVMYLAVMAFLTTLLAEWTGWSLLLQGQAYRALWIAKWFSVPLAAIAIRRQFRQDGWWHVASTGFVLWGLFESLAPLPSVAWLGLGVPLQWCYLYWTRKGEARPTGRQPETTKCTPAMKRALLGGAFGVLLAVSIAGAIQGMSRAWSSLHGVEAALLGLPRFVPILVAWPTAIGILVAMLRVPRRGLVLAGAIVTLVGINSATGYLVWRSSQRDATFVAKYVGCQDDGQPDVVYWPGAAVTVWQQLHARVYHDFVQTFGVIFSRSTAEEALRRGQLVAAFEIQALRAQIDDAQAWGRMLRFLGRPWDSPPPSSQDLRRLVRDEPNLDWIVLPYHLPDCPSHSNGRLFLYHAATLREAPIRTVSHIDATP